MSLQTREARSGWRRALVNEHEPPARAACAFRELIFSEQFMGVRGQRTSKLQQRQLDAANVAVIGPTKQHNSRIARPAPPPRSASPDIGPRDWVGRAIDWIEPVENPAGVIYGVLAIGALLAAESGRHESYADTLGSVLIALCLYWLAHAYADVLGHRTI